MWLLEARDLGLYQLYRTMDILAEHGDMIEEEVFWNSADLFKLDVDLVFYDATTAWFECDDEDVANYTWKASNSNRFENGAIAKKAGTMIRR